MTTSDQRWLGHYILDDEGKPKACDAITWARWFERAENRIVRHTRMRAAGEVFLISTVFLGIDHHFGPEPGPPLLWETMVLGNTPDGNDRQRRFASREAALDYHLSVESALKAAFNASLVIDA